jgi:hypothetical protein
MFSENFGGFKSTQLEQRKRDKGGGGVATVGMFDNSYFHRCTQGGGEGEGGAPHVPPTKILKNFHIKMQ